MGKSGPNATFNLISLGLGWPWVGEFVGLIIIFTGFPTQQNMVDREHPIDTTHLKKSVHVRGVKEVEERVGVHEQARRAPGKEAPPPPAVVLAP